jgi:methyltransferase (TIGR00027 family)
VTVNAHGTSDHAASEHGTSELSASRHGASQHGARQHGTREPSNTAMTAAAARAAHLIVDESPFIFADTCAAALLGHRADELIGYHRQHSTHAILAAARGQVSCRSRFAEDRLAAAVAAGVRQYMVLGAGLDTFAYRPPLAGQVRVFEVDHPATQEWKRAALAAAQLDATADVVFVAADLATDSLAGALDAAGFDFGRPAVISWLGVIMYLDRPAIGQTLSVLAACAPGSELIADYMLPQALRDEAGNFYAEMIMAAAADRGEPWRSFFAPGEMSDVLAEHGFGAARQVRQRESVPAELWHRADALQPIELSMIAWARLGVA